MTKLNFLLSRLGYVPDLTSRQSRSVSVSFASRMRVLAILLLCLTLGVGNVWGADTQVYSTGFESTTTDTQYQGTVTCTSSEGNGASWTIYYGNFSTDAVISGSKGAQMRLYKDGKCGYLEQTSNISNVDSVRFAYKCSNTNVRFKVQYSTNSGSSWNDWETGLGGNTTTSYFKKKLGTRASTFRLKIVVTGGHPSSSNRKLTIDDIVYKTVSDCDDPATALSVSAAATTIFAGVQTQLSTSGGNGNTITYSVTSANSTYATIDGSNKFSATQAGTYTVQASQDENGGTCGGTATVNITVRYQVKWSVNGNDSYTTGSPTTYIGTHNTKVSTLPTDPTSAMCDNTKVFVGWTTSSYSHATNAPTTLFLTAASSPNVTDNVTYYAVFANRTDFTRVTSTSQLAAGKQIVVVDDQNSKVLTTAPGYDTAPTESSSKITPSNNMIWTLEANSTNWKLKTSGSYLGASGTSNGTAVSLTSTNSIWNIATSSGATNTFYLQNTAKDNLCLEYYSSGSSWVVYANNSYTSSTYFTERLYVATLTNYATTCCTTLGSINGSFTFSNVSATSVTVGVPSDYSDKNNANLQGYIFKRYAASTGGSALETIETNSSSGTTATFSTGLVANTAYYYTIIAKHSSSSCNSEETSPRKSHTITSYIVSYAAGDGSGDNPGAHNPVLSGTNVTLKANTFDAPAGKQFAGWNDGTNDYDAGDSYSVTANKTMTAQWSCITPAISSSSISNASYSIGDTPADLSVTASGGTMSYEWKQCATENGTYVTVTGGTGGNTDTYTPPTSAASDLWYQCTVTNTGSSCNTTATSGKAHIIVSAPSYRLWTAWANGNDCDGDICNTWNWTGGSYFVNYNSTNEWRISNFTIPDFEWDAVNQRQMIYNVAGKNATNTKFYDLALAVSQGSASVKKGPMPGAVGTLRMYDNSDQPNGYLGFLPNKYMIRFGTHDYVMSETSTTVWETAIQTLDAADLTNVSQFRVGVTNSSDEFVAINENCSLTNVTSMGQKSDAGNNWGSNIAAGDAGKRGKFRIWLDNASNNWNAHFVPYHRIIFDANWPSGGIGDEPADTYSVDVSVEETNSSISLASAPTAPAGYTFAGWFTESSGGTQRTGAQTISAGATADVTLFAHWTANDNTAYTVKHYQQNIANDDYTEVTGDRQNLTGTTDASVTPAVKSYTGFTAPSTQTVTILGDGSQVVNYYYTRNSYNLTWNLGGGTTTTAGTGIASGVSVNTTSSVKFGTSLTAPTVTKTGYGFNAWSSAVAGTMPAAATTYTATWNATNYTITYNDLEGATNSNPATYTIESEAITLVDPGTRDGYTFAGWYTNEGKTSPVSTPAIAAESTGNKTFWAKWDRNYYTITWHVGASTSTTEDVEHGTTFSTLEASAPAHADNALETCGSTKFIGWVKAAGVWTDEGKTVAWYNTHKYAAADQITDNVDIYAMYAEGSGSDGAITLTHSDFVTSYSTSYNTITKGDYSFDYAQYQQNTNGTPNSPDLWCREQLIQARCTLTNNGLYNTTPMNVTSIVVYMASPTSNSWSVYEGTSEKPTSDAITPSAGSASSITANSYSSSTKLCTDDGITTATETPYTYTISSSDNQYFNILPASKVVYFTKIVINYSNVTYTNYRTGCTVSCGAPTGLTVVNPSTSASTVTKTGATIYWTGNATGKLDHYEYAYWVDGDTEPTSGFVNNGTNTSATLSGLYSGVKYNWKVRKVCTGEDNSRWAKSNFTTLDATLTYSVPDGVSAVSTPATTAGNLNSADVPTDCGSCWVFAGWTTAEYAANSSAPAALFLEGTKARVSGDATLYAVYKKDEFKTITTTSELVANDDYLIGTFSNENACIMKNTAQATYPTTDAAVTDVNDQFVVTEEAYYIYNPDADNIWRFTGTYSSGQLYNSALDKYLNLSSTENSILGATDNLTFAANANYELAWDVNSTNYLHGYGDASGGFEAVAPGSWESGEDISAYIYRRQSVTYATSPSCPKYTVTFQKGDATHDTKYVTACARFLDALPASNPADNYLSCATKFMGWSAETLSGTGHDAPADLFDNVADAPEISDDITFHAVFATTIGTPIAAVEDNSFTTTSEGGSYGSATYSFKSVGQYLQKQSIWTSENMANVKVKIRVYHFQNGSADVLRVSLINSSGAEVVGADLNTNHNATNISSGGWSDYVELTPTSAVTGYKVSMKTKNSSGTGINKIEREVVASGVQDYLTKCCNDPELAFDGEHNYQTLVRQDIHGVHGGNGSATEEQGKATLVLDYSTESSGTCTVEVKKLTRGDNRSTSAAGASCANYTNIAINESTKKVTFDIWTYAGSYPTANGQGTYRIKITQAAASTYCDAVAYYFVDVTLRDKFVDAVNGNTTINVDGQSKSTTDYSKTPTEASLDADKNDDCHSTTRRLVGWVREDNIDTWYGSSTDRTRDLDDKSEDAALVAPNADIITTGSTWYAIWGIEE